MIIFHEGLPRSGKSYEAAINRIIPALQAGRKVFAYIEGLNHEKFAEITGKPLDEIKGRVEHRTLTTQEYAALADEEKQRVSKGKDSWTIKTYPGLLHQVDAEQVKTIYDHVENDSLVIIDELQDFWPSDRAKLGDGITQFITQHGHRGLDIVVMGQDHRDCHALWKRRIDQLITFVKLDAVGMADRYTWTTFKANKGKFVQLRSGQGKYDEKYFGLYKSHTDGTSNKATYNDDRANLLKSSAIRYGLPGALAVGVVAVWYLVSFMTGGQDVVKVAKASTAEVQQGQVEQRATARRPEPEQARAEQEKPKELPKAMSHAQYIEQIVTKFKPRLAGLITGTGPRGEPKTVGYVEFMDETNHVKERFDLKQLESFGWAWGVRPYGLELHRGMQSIAVTAWPIDVYGKVPQSTQTRLNSDENPTFRAANVERS
ncbi:zonular occludens toxin family protein [Methylomonas albis]|uniref:Zonular occludens toxin n=1 Tax=Methylomonas albis TaxID=1854563 RepID=A0ABR9D5K1_9GAMM|nr:zonular occludens toxin domain-containing protein [Methylomonas albis]MBD9357489.1 Zonular occludens toxin [Methylomonas albis]